MKNSTYKDLVYTFDRNIGSMKETKISHFRQGNRVKKDVAKNGDRNSLFLTVRDIHSREHLFLY